MTCPYYLRETIRVESREPGKPGSKYVLCLWCKHEFSPVTRKRAKSADGNHLLQCEGDISRCQLPAEHRLSV